MFQSGHLPLRGAPSSLPLEGEVAFAKQMTVGGQVGSWNSGGTPLSLADARQLPLMGSLIAGDRKGLPYNAASVGP